MANKPRILHAKDNQILTLLKRDCRATDSEIATSVRLTRQTVATRIKKLEEANIIKGFEAVIDYAALGLSQHELFITVATFAGEEKQALIAYFTAHPFVRWLAELFGEPHLRVSIVSASTQHFAEILSGIERDIGANIRDLRVITLLRRVRNATRERHEQADRTVMLDATDVTILETLAREPRATLVTIAERANNSIENVRQRKRRLEETHIVTGYTTTVDLERTDERAWCVVYVRFRSGEDAQRAGLYTFLHEKTESGNIDLLLGEWHLSVTFAGSSLYRVHDAINAFTQQFAKHIVETRTFIHLAGYKYPKVPQGVFALLRERSAHERAP